MNKHEHYMKKVIDLAQCGWGTTNPNPLVGAIVVKDGQIIAEGYHAIPGGAHAEVDALHKAKQDVRGGTIYVNLEPCSHYGRTPPCTKAIIEAGIKQVVIAMSDPNPRVSGQGIRILKDAGINVVEGILFEEARRLNEIFVKYITEEKPFVIMKTAMTLDGKIASYSGDSKWISGEGSRRYVHKVRDRVAAIMVGINTVLRDDPQLTTRLDGQIGRDCIRIIADSKGKIPLDCNAVTVKSSAPVLLATTQMIEKEKEKRLLDKGVIIIKTESRDGYVDLQQLMDELYKMEIDSVLLEGGGNLNASALDAGIVDKLMFFIAPKIIMGQDAKTPVEGKGKEYIKDAVKLNNINIKRFEDDILYEAYINK